MAKSTKKTSHKRPRRPKQEMLLDVQHPAEKKLLELAERYREARDARMEAQKPEAEAQAALLTAMREESLERFQADGVLIYIARGEDKVKVKKVKSPNGDDDASGVADGDGG